MSTIVDSVEKLEACIGAPGLPVKMKIIDHLDATAAKWIAAAPVAFVGFGGSAPRIAVAGGPAGFATVKETQTLVLPRDALDGIEALDVGQGAGALFLVPGIGETLRVNGRVGRVGNAEIEIAVEECFVHCAKALIRSDFWNAAAVSAPDDAAGFLNATRFLVLATMDGQGRIDISPKGDPAGLLIRFEGGRAVLAERPGNRLAFGYRNIIAQPLVAIAGLIPGANATVALGGRAHLSTDETLRGVFAVEGKTPILATVIDAGEPELHASAALERAGLWAGTAGPPAINPAETMVAHVKLNKARGMAAAAVRLAVNPGVLVKALAHNYKTDLY